MLAGAAAEEKDREGAAELGAQSMEKPGGEEAVKRSEEEVTAKMTNEIPGSGHPAARRQGGGERLAAERQETMF